VKYSNYKKFGSKVKITYDGKELPRADQGTDQKPPQPTTPPQ
jgi:hypothetical protein